jgi:hypothetical protein
LPSIFKKAVDLPDACNKLYAARVGVLLHKGKCICVEMDLILLAITAIRKLSWNQFRICYVIGMRYCQPAKIWPDSLEPNVNRFLSRKYGIAGGRHVLDANPLDITEYHADCFGLIYEGEDPNVLVNEDPLFYLMICKAITMDIDTVRSVVILTVLYRP